MVRYGKLDRHDLSALRTVLFAGEVFPIKYLRELISVVPHATYYNLYGPDRDQRLHVLPSATARH